MHPFFSEKLMILRVEKKTNPKPHSQNAKKKNRIISHSIAMLYCCVPVSLLCNCMHVHSTAILWLNFKSALLCTELRHSHFNTVKL